MTNSVQNVNNVIWFFATILIAFVVLQATVFLRMALKFNKRNNILTDGEIKTAMKTGGISVIAPALSVTVIALSLITMIGPATTFMRVGVIGSASYELMLANIAAETLGVELGSNLFTEPIFVLAIFGMVFGSAPYFINCLLTLKPMDKTLQKSSKKKNSFIPILGLASSMGILGYSGMGQLIKGIPYIVSFFVSLLLAKFLMMYIAKTGKRGLSDWIMAICMVVGMTFAMIAKNLL